MPESVVMMIMKRKLLLAEQIMALLSAGSIKNVSKFD